MRLTYENLVRAVLLLLLIVGSLTDKTVSPALTIIIFIVFETIVRKFEKPAPIKDHSNEVKELSEKLAKLEQTFTDIKGDIGVAAISASIRRR